MTRSLLMKRLGGALTGLALIAGSGAASAAESILFVGNSFTYAQGSPVMHFGSDTVTDLNGEGIGGIPALFKAFTLQAGLDYAVSLETVGGSGLDLHYQTKMPLIDRAWDRVVLQSYSTLDAAAPGNPAKLIQYSGLLADAFHAKNADVQVSLMATWSRADQTYPANGAWHGQSIYQMARDVYAGYAAADAASDHIDGVIPVGLAWNRAMAQGFADTNPYDGIEAGKVKLWADDNYHASKYGSYLEALTIFGKITGLDPRGLGSNESAAAALGISAAQAATMQQLAFDQLAAPVPEPSSWAMLVAGLGLLAFWRRRGGGVTPQPTSGSRASST